MSKKLTYREACRALGYDYEVPTTPKGEEWLVEVVDRVVSTEGEAALNGPAGDDIRQIFDGILGPRPEQTRPKQHLLVKGDMLNDAKTRGNSQAM